MHCQAGSKPWRERAPARVLHVGQGDAAHRFWAPIVDLRGGSGGRAETHGWRYARAHRLGQRRGIKLHAHTNGSAHPPTKTPPPSHPPTHAPTHKQTDRQTDRQKDRQTDRHTQPPPRTQTHFARQAGAPSSPQPAAHPPGGQHDLPLVQPRLPVVVGAALAALVLQKGARQLVAARLLARLLHHRRRDDDFGGPGGAWPGAGWVRRRGGCAGITWSCWPHLPLRRCMPAGMQRGWTRLKWDARVGQGPVRLPRPPTCRGRR